MLKHIEMWHIERGMQMCGVWHVLLRQISALPCKHRVLCFSGIVFLLEHPGCSIRREISKLCVQLLAVAVTLP